MVNRKQETSDKKKKPLADRWLGRLRNNPVIAGVIVLATIVGATIGMWDKLKEFYDANIKVPVSVAALNISENADLLIDEKQLTCLFDGKNVRTFSTTATIKENIAIPIDFVLVNTSDQDAIVTSVDFVISAAESVRGGQPGIVVPNHTYLIELEHEKGKQSFPLIPPYKIPGNDTGSFTIAFKPANDGIGLCWIMKAEFNTRLGSASTPEFSLIMSRF